MPRIALVGVWLMVMVVSAMAGPLKCVVVCPVKKLELPKSASADEMGFMVLQIANQSDKPVLVDLFGRISPRLKLPDRQTINAMWLRDDSVRPSKSDFAWVSPGRSLFVTVDFGFTNTRSMPVLSGSLDGSTWAFEIPWKPGKYEMSLIYRPKKEDFPAALAGDPAFRGEKPWFGEMETNRVGIEIGK